MDFMKPKKNGIKPVKPTIIKTTIRHSPRPALPPRSATSSALASGQRANASAMRVPSSSSRSSPATPPVDQNISRLHTPKRKASRQKSPAQTRLTIDSDSDDDTSTTNKEANKRLKMEFQEDVVVDMQRQLRSRKAFAEADGGVFEMVHAADVTRKAQQKAAIKVENLTVRLRYPSASQLERYDLAWVKDTIDPVEEIIKIADTVANVYLKPEQAEAFTDPFNGHIRQLEKARNNLSNNKDKNLTDELLNKFILATKDYNSAIKSLLKKGFLAENLDARHHIPFKMVELIRNQVYDRTVSPHVDTLQKYQNGTDEVYGELNACFVSKLLAQTGLKSDQVFVDLGSGVGNVVLQAALQVGCESWGCEFMPNAYTLAAAAHREFVARCRLWGIQPGEVHLEKGDFTKNDKIHKILKKADVIIVNNKAFGEDTQRNLINMFLDLKDGCKVVSLKSFKHSDQEITSRNHYDPANIFDVEPHYFGSGDVSWASTGGEYFISTKDPSHLRAFAKRI